MLIIVRRLIIVFAGVLLLVQRNTVEPVLNRPLMLAVAVSLAFNQVMTTLERPIDYSFTSFTSMIALFVLYFAFPFRFSTRLFLSLAMSLAELFYIMKFKQYAASGKFTVLATYLSFNSIFSFWSISNNTMRRKNFMDMRLLREAKEHSEFQYRTLSHDIRAPFAGLLLESDRLDEALKTENRSEARSISVAMRTTLITV